MTFIIIHLIYYKIFHKIELLFETSKWTAEAFFLL